MTSKLLDISDYTSLEIAQAVDFSSAIALYLGLILKPTIDSAHELRIERHSAWLRSALATFHQKHSTAEICSFWSDAADNIVNKAWQLSGCDNESLALIALGKWGSKELNLSSDIDIVFISEDTTNVQMLQCVRHFIALLSDLTPFGFCFRTDTDLKPGGRLSPLICSVKQFENYYWSSGETWERLALVRMRAICGKKEIYTAAHDISKKFVFRKFIDYSLLEDLKRLRSQIHSHYPQIEPNKINLKLAPGGIRDIELFIHALQVIHGGKDASLRTTSTSVAANALMASNRFNKNDLQFLIDTYWQFRDLENRVQIMSDTQTHDWQVAYGKEEFRKFKDLASRVSAIVEPVLGKPTSIPTLPTDSSERMAWLKSHNYSNLSIEQKIPELLSLTAISTRTFQDEELRLKVLRKFIETLALVALDKDLGVALLVDFFKATRAKTAFFSLLAHEDRLVRELCILFGCSPYLGGILAARPELLDSYLYRAQAEISANLERLLDDLTERRLLNEIISAIQLLQTKDIATLCTSLSASADEICCDLLNALKREYGVTELQILALGKWGGNELGFRSDLDFIFLTPNAPTELDQKIARRFIARLTEQHKGGKIFEVDMRLRPSGKGGPLLVSYEMLNAFLHEKAEVWERQSYLRSRIIGQEQPVESSTAIRADASAKSINPEELLSLKEIRERLLRHSDDQIEIKYSPGGLVDIEFSTQIAILKGKLVAPPDTIGMIDLLAQTNTHYQMHKKELIKNYYFLRQIEQFFQLLSQHPVTALKVSDEVFIRVAAVLSTAPNDLYTQLQQILVRTAEILIDVDLRRPQK